MTVRGFNEHTRRDYVRHVRLFAAFIGRSPETTTAEDLRLFQLHQTQSGMQPELSLGPRPQRGEPLAEILRRRRLCRRRRPSRRRCSGHPARAGSDAAASPWPSPHRPRQGRAAPPRAWPVSATFRLLVERVNPAACRAASACRSAVSRCWPARIMSRRARSSSERAVLELAAGLGIGVFEHLEEILGVGRVLLLALDFGRHLLEHRDQRFEAALERCAARRVASVAIWPCSCSAAAMR